MALLDKFLDAIKLNDDDDYDDDDFLDDEFDDEEEDIKPKNRFFKRFKDEDLDDDDDDFDDDDDLKPIKKSATKAKKEEKTSAIDRFDMPKASDKQSKDKTAYKDKAAKRSKVTPMRRTSKAAGMEVNVIRPLSMEDARDIADTLMDGCTVILNLEGLDVDTAQRIIDFTCGSCYSLNGSLQKVSSYIFILTPKDVDISGDYEDILGDFDLPSMKAPY